MIDNDTMMAVAEAEARRQAARRRFLQTAGQATIIAGGLSVLAACGGSGDSSSTATTTPTPSPSSTGQINDRATQIFSLHLAYLQAQFFAYATTGSGISASLLTGLGTAGSVTGGRAVTFTDPLVGEYAREIAADDLAHVGFLRSALGSQSVAMPNINIDGTSATAPFARAAQLAGYVAGGAPFDPYASDVNFLLAAFFLKDVAVTGYKYATTLTETAIYMDALAGVLSTQSYHAGTLRTLLYTKGQTVAAQQFSDARDNLDGPTDDDQGVGVVGTANIAPTDAGGGVFTRTAGQVLNILFLNSAAVTSGGFFPNGVNGTITTSAASV